MTAAETTVVTGGNVVVGAEVDVDVDVVLVVAGRLRVASMRVGSPDRLTAASTLATASPATTSARNLTGRRSPIRVRIGRAAYSAAFSSYSSA